MAPRVVVTVAYYPDLPPADLDESWMGRTSGIVGLHEVVELSVRGRLGGDEAIVGSRLGSHELVKLALRHELLAMLRVLDGEHHHDRDGRRRRVQRDLPPRRKAGDDADDAPPGEEGGDGGTCGGLGRPVAEPVQHVAAASVMGSAQ